MEKIAAFSMFPIKRTVFLCTVTLVKNTVRLIGNIQGAPYVFERFSEAVLRSWVDVEMKCHHIFLAQVYTFQIP